jgi:transaldolase
MKLFLDTANKDEIREAYGWGILDGVTTNPSHVSKEDQDFFSLIDDICKLVPDGEISVEVTATDIEGILNEARVLAGIHDNIVVKVPLIKPGIQAIKVLSGERISVNTTLCFSAVQGLLAAKVGATFISPFVGRLDKVGADGMELVEQLRTIYDNYGLKTQVLASALRHPKHVLESALAGADAATMKFSILDQLFHHPQTDSGLEAFLQDWKKLDTSIV